MAVNQNEIPPAFWSLFVESPCIGAKLPEFHQNFNFNNSNFYNSAVAEANPSPATLTFLFTDIEGSTNLWEQYPDAMKTALATHDALMRQTIETQGGKIFKTVGDAFHAVFGKPEDALAAAI